MRKTAFEYTAEEVQTLLQKKNGDDWHDDAKISQESSFIDRLLNGYALFNWTCLFFVFSILSVYYHLLNLAKLWHKDRCTERQVRNEVSDHLP